MTSAKERAVEAGARAMVAAIYLGWEVLPISEKTRWKLRADACIRAAFPILAEDVFDIAAAYLKEQYGASYGLDHPVDRERIRARIQQMAEAL